MTRHSEERVYARHRRRRGSVLIIGGGSVGGFLAEELAHLGFSPLMVIDRDYLEPENLPRHVLGAQDLGEPKAPALARKISTAFPLCRIAGLHADFERLPLKEQRRLIGAFDVVVAATDSNDCQRRINELCLSQQVPAVYPGVWVGGDIPDAEVSEVLWVLPDRRTPCYLCATGWREAGGNAEARGGTGADIRTVVQAAVWVVAALLEPNDPRAALLNDERTLLLVHSFMPMSDAVAPLFARGHLRAVRVPFPATPCPACGAWEPEPHFDPLVRATQPRRQARFQWRLLLLPLLILVFWRTVGFSSGTQAPRSSPSRTTAHAPGASTPPAPGSSPVASPSTQSELAVGSGYLLSVSNVSFADNDVEVTLDVRGPANMGDASAVCLIDDRGLTDTPWWYQLSVNQPGHYAGSFTFPMPLDTGVVYYLTWGCDKHIGRVPVFSR